MRVLQRCQQARSPHPPQDTPGGQGAFLEQPTLSGRKPQISSVAQSCPTLCDSMDCSSPGLPVQHQFPEFAQTHVHRVSDTIPGPQPGFRARLSRPQAWNMPWGLAPGPSWSWGGSSSQSLILSTPNSHPSQRSGRNLHTGPEAPAISIAGRGRRKETSGKTISQQTTQTEYQEAGLLSHILFSAQAAGLRPPSDSQTLALEGGAQPPARNLPPNPTALAGAVEAPGAAGRSPELSRSHVLTRKVGTIPPLESGGCGFSPEAAQHAVDQRTGVCTPGPDRGLLTPEPTSSLWPPCPPPAAGRGMLAEGRAPPAPNPQASLAHTLSRLCFQCPHWPASTHPGIPWTHIVPVPSASSLWAAVTEVENCTLQVQSAHCQKDIVGPATQPPSETGETTWPLAGLTDIAWEWVLCVSSPGLPNHRD